MSLLAGCELITTSVGLLAVIHGRQTACLAWRIEYRLELPENRIMGRILRVKRRNCEEIGGSMSTLLGNVSALLRNVSTLFRNVITLL